CSAPRAPLVAPLMRSCSLHSTWTGSDSSSWPTKPRLAPPSPENHTGRLVSGAPRLTGQRIKRVEDPRLLTGQGAFLDDLRLPGLLHAAFARSLHAHALIRSVDLARARSSPGVAAALSGRDLVAYVEPFTP